MKNVDQENKVKNKKKNKTKTLCRIAPVSVFLLFVTLLDHYYICVNINQHLTIRVGQI